MKLPLLSQYDKSWGEIPMGQSGVKLKKAGCLTTCVSIASYYFWQFAAGCARDPGWIASHLKYTASGMFVWEELPKFFPFKLEQRVEGRQTKLFDAALEDPRKVLILELNHGAHFVFCLKRIGGYYVIDPYGGKYKWYWSQITGGRILKLNLNARN